MLDRFVGCILGLACGDALGATLEFLSRAEVQRRYGRLSDLVGGGWLNLAPGDDTDDTQMTLCILESISDRRDIDPADIARRFVTWYDSHPPDIGNLTRQSLERLRRGANWDEAGKQTWESSGRSAAGNGGVMRCAPIGLFRCDDEIRLAEDSRQICGITHHDPRCQDSCVAINWAIAQLVTGNAIELEALGRLVAPDLVSSIRAAENMPLDELAEQTTGGYTNHPVRLAFWALVNTSSYEEDVVSIANLGEDADTNAAVTGALLGARYGAGAIPSRWLGTLRRRGELEALAERLFDLVAKRDEA